MPRSIWTGAISFGLVNVPVKLFSAVSSKSVRFHQLHAEDGGRVKQKRVCSVDGEEVSYDEIVKGYELGPDRYVVIEPGELEALDPKASRTIDIEDFVEIDQVDPIYFDHAYYLAPNTGAAKSYKLLHSAMQDAGRAAVARLVMRQKQYLAILRATDDGVIALSTMYYGDEVTDPSGIDELDAIEEAEANDREVGMAKQLIDSLSTEWDPAKYSDTYRERVIDLIERKAAGEEIAVQPEAEPEAVPDLMAALEASLAAVKSDSKGNGESKETKETKAKAKPSKAKSSPAKSKPKAGNGSSSSTSKKKAGSGAKKS
jgi:DNA end-binding protein Ku